MNKDFKKLKNILELKRKVMDEPFHQIAICLSTIDALSTRQDILNEGRKIRDKKSQPVRVFLPLCVRLSLLPCVRSSCVGWSKVWHRHSGWHRECQ